MPNPPAADERDSTQPDPAGDTAVADRPQATRTTHRVIFAVAGGALLFVLASTFFDFGIFKPGSKEPEVTSSAAAMFVPPDPSTIPDTDDGKAIRRGMAIFTNTGTNARDFVGNDLACSNCHLDNGRRGNAAPMWAAWVVYPKYRSKNKQVNDMEDRVKGCFTYSMNAQASPSGGPPPYGSPVYRDLEMYFEWLATGAVVGKKMDGAGYPEVPKTKAGHDPQRGAQVFAQNCASCHGVDGQGQRDVNGRVVFPPLWGPHSYNWGAGMAKVSTAAGFIKANMPLGQTNRLSDQEAWDVAAFIDSRPRPKDPRQTGSVADAAKQYHKSGTYYGQTIDGTELGNSIGKGGTGR